jgi:hypothetical protein
MITGIWRGAVRAEDAAAYVDGHPLAVSVCGPVGGTGEADE